MAKDKQTTEPSERQQVAGRRFAAAWFGGLGLLVVLLVFSEDIGQGIASWWFMYVLGIVTGLLVPYVRRKLRLRRRR